MQKIKYAPLLCLGGTASLWVDILYENYYKYIYCIYGFKTLKYNLIWKDRIHNLDI